MGKNVTYNYKGKAPKNKPASPPPPRPPTPLLAPISHPTFAFEYSTWPLRILDSRYWIPVFASGAWILDYNRQWDSGLLELYFGFQSRGFRIPQVKVPGFRIPQAKSSRILESRFTYMGYEGAESLFAGHTQRCCCLFVFFVFSPFHAPRFNQMPRLSPRAFPKNHAFRYSLRNEVITYITDT